MTYYPRTLAKIQVAPESNGKEFILALYDSKAERRTYRLSRKKALHLASQIVTKLHNTLPKGE